MLVKRWRNQHRDPAAVYRALALHLGLIWLIASYPPASYQEEFT